MRQQLHGPVMIMSSPGFQYAGVAMALADCINNNYIGNKSVCEHFTDIGPLPIILTWVVNL